MHCSVTLAIVTLSSPAGEVWLEQEHNNSGRSIIKQLTQWAPTFRQSGQRYIWQQDFNPWLHPVFDAHRDSPGPITRKLCTHGTACFGRYQCSQRPNHSSITCSLAHAIQDEHAEGPITRAANILQQDSVYLQGAITSYEDASNDLYNVLRTQCHDLIKTDCAEPLAAGLKCSGWWWLAFFPNGLEAILLY